MQTFASRQQMLELKYVVMWSSGMLLTLLIIVAVYLKIPFILYDVHLSPKTLTTDPEFIWGTYGGPKSIQLGYNYRMA